MSGDASPVPDITELGQTALLVNEFVKQNPSAKTTTIENRTVAETRSLLRDLDQYIRALQREQADTLDFKRAIKATILHGVAS